LRKTRRYLQKNRRFSLQLLTTSQQLPSKCTREKEKCLLTIQIEVTFDIDANGILHVSAKDKGTGKEQSIKITATSGLTEEEIQNMTKDAESHSTEDKKKRQLVEKKNEADSLIYTVEKSLREHGNKISEGDTKNIKDALEKCKKAKDTADNVEEIQNAITELTTASHKLAEHLYKTADTGAQQATGAEAGPGPSPSEEKSEKEDVVEAEFEESDKDKKEN
jgi:molecular chaperone DnaK